MATILSFPAGRGRVPDDDGAPDHGHAADRGRVPDSRTPDREPQPVGPQPLWREVLGRSLRAARQEQGGRLADVAGRAGVSPQYLSEIERGRKDPSSEMIAAITGALGVDLADLLAGVAGDIRRHRAVPASPRRQPAGPVLLAA